MVDEDPAPPYVEKGPVLVLGGTGQLGRDLVGRLIVDGWQVRVLSRKPGSDPRVSWVLGDLATGEGLSVGLAGATHVVHAATNSPIAQRGSIRLADLRDSPTDVEIDGTRHLLDAVRRADIEHFVFVSIVGLEDSSLPYSKVKLAAEAAIRSSGLPWSVVRATPFFYLVERMLDGLHRWPVWPLPGTAFQPVDTRDVAGHLVQCLGGDDRGLLPEIGGPEITSYAAMARAHLHARGKKRAVLSLPLPARLARQGGLVVAQGVRGVRTWARWLEEQTAGLP